MRNTVFNSLTALGRSVTRRLYKGQQLCCTKVDVQINQFCNVVNGKQLGDNEVGEIQSADKQTSCSAIRLAFKLLYIGQRYNGMQFQQDKGNTIEDHLFSALIKSRLIRDMDSCRYGRSSRTDSGVSAISQIVSFDVHEDYHNWRRRIRMLSRPYITEDDQDFDELQSAKDIRQSIVNINQLLPFDIKVLAWATVPSDYFPRKQKYIKTYKYWFLKEDLDLELMSQACERFEGTHDFRNFCKLEYRHNYECRITDATVEACEDNAQMCVFTVTGTRFLMHQIRYMVNILWLIGRKKEAPTIIDELLDIDKNPSKPNFSKAKGLSLCLYKVALKDDIKWIHDLSIHSKITRDLEEHWRNSMLMTSLTKGALDDLKNTEFDTAEGYKKWLDAVPQKIRKTHKPIMDTPRGPTVEIVKKRQDRKQLLKRMMKDPAYELDSNDKLILLDNPDIGVVSDDPEVDEVV